MKFATVVVLLAVALGIEASGHAWSGHYAPALSYTAVSGPATYDAWGHGAYAAPAAYGAYAAPAAYGAYAAPAAYGAYAAPAAYGAYAAPATWGAHGAWTAPAAVDITHGAWGRGAWAHNAWATPAVAVHAPAAISTHTAIAPAGHALAHEGSYIAKTRGATHIAPLAGHAHSAAAINVHPAPGTV